MNLGLCGARSVIAQRAGQQVIGFCTARALHDGQCSPEESLSTVASVLTTRMATWNAARPAA